VSLPPADDLFRRTADDRDTHETRSSTGDRQPAVRAVPDPEPAASREADPGDEAPRRGSGRRRPSGRVRHDEKMTVYVTSEELLAIEHARLALRSAHGLAVDRGRLVREALHLVLDDLDEHGEQSALVRRLQEG